MNTQKLSLAEYSHELILNSCLAIHSDPDDAEAEAAYINESTLYILDLKKLAENNPGVFMQAVSEPESGTTFEENYFKEYGIHLYRAEPHFNNRHCIDDSCLTLTVFIKRMQRILQYKTIYMVSAVKDYPYTPGCSIEFFAKLPFSIHREMFKI